MFLSSKHQNQQPVVRRDFSGGLNTTSTVEGIAENQLADVLNMEVDHSTGCLKTVAGTKTLLEAENVFAAAYDGINHVLLVVLEDRTVHATALDGAALGDSLGKLTGELYPVCAAWEDGLLLASGGKLQYYNGKTLVTLDSPDAKSVYIRAGRVPITDDANVRHSGVGDETNWTEDTNDASSSKWIEAGYKDGGKFVGMCNLSSDVLLIKDNRRVYRLSGEFPDWQIAEVSRNIECGGRRSFCSIADNVLIFGGTELQAVQTTQDYGDMKTQNMATLVARELAKLPKDALVRYVPALSQVWLLGTGGTVLVFDTTLNAWFKRQFNTDILDVLSIGENVLVVRKGGIAKLDESTFYDAGRPLSWRFVAQRLVSQHDYLLKRVQVSIVPYESTLYYGQVSVGAVIVGLPIPARLTKIWHNRSPIFKNRAKVMLAGRLKGTYVKGDVVFDNPALLYGNTQKLFSRHTFIRERRNVFRSKALDVKGTGGMGGFSLNSIVMDIAEV